MQKFASKIVRSLPYVSLCCHRSCSAHEWFGEFYLISCKISIYLSVVSSFLPVDTYIFLRTLYPFWLIWFKESEIFTQLFLRYCLVLFYRLVFFLLTFTSYIICIRWTNRSESYRKLYSRPISNHREWHKTKPNINLDRKRKMHGVMVVQFCHMFVFILDFVDDGISLTNETVWKLW